MRFVPTTRHWVVSTQGTRGVGRQPRTYTVTMEPMVTCQSTQVWMMPAHRSQADST